MYTIITIDIVSSSEGLGENEEGLSNKLNMFPVTQHLPNLKCGTNCVVNIPSAGKTGPTVIDKS